MIEIEMDTGKEASGKTEDGAAKRVAGQPGFGTTAGDVSDNEYWNYCDNCGTRLETFRCRYVCPKCGFFHSCSEP